MLLKLVREHKKCGVQTEIISLGTLGAVGRELRSLGVVVHAVGAKGRRIPRIIEGFRFFQIIKRFSPNIIQGWMYHGNFAAFLARYFVSPRPAIFWNIRQTLGALEDEAFLTRALIWLGSKISQRADGIIFNSTESQRQHTRIGYAMGKGRFIPNGFDTAEYRVDHQRRYQERAKLGIKEDGVLVGHIGRYHPKKDHFRFFKVVAEILEKRSNVHVIAVGRDVSQSNTSLGNQLIGMRGGERINLLGEKEDLGSIYQALDILVSSSAWGEGFSNVIGEGMASECFCIATNVGEAARMIKGVGKVIEPKNAAALTEAILEAVDMSELERKEVGARARQKIKEEYSIARIADRYLTLYRQAGIESKNMDLTKD